MPEPPSQGRHPGVGIVRWYNFQISAAPRWPPSSLNTLWMFQCWTKTAYLSTSLSPSNSTLNLAGLPRVQNIELATLKKVHPGNELPALPSFMYLQSLLLNLLELFPHFSLIERKESQNIHPWVKNPEFLKYVQFFKDWKEREGFRKWLRVARLMIFFNKPWAQLWTPLLSVLSWIGLWWVE